MSTKQATTKTISDMTVLKGDKLKKELIDVMLDKDTYVLMSDLKKYAEGEELIVSVDKRYKSDPSGLYKATSSNNKAVISDDTGEPGENGQISYFSENIDTLEIRSNTALTSLTIPSTITNCDLKNLSLLTKLKDLTIEMNYQLYNQTATSLENNVVYPRSLTNLKLIDKTGFNADSIQGLPYDNSYITTLSKITYPTSDVFFIQNQLSNLTNLKELTLGSNTKVLPPRFCYKMNNLTKINNCENIQVIRNDALYYAKDAVLDSPDNVVIVDDNGMRETGIEHIDHHWNNLKYIGEDGFNFSRKLLTVDFGIRGHYLCLGDEAFSSCHELKSVNFNGLKLISLAHANKERGYQWFVNCYELEYVNLGLSCDSIPISCFGDCSSLCQVVLPRSVGEYGDSMFSNCLSLPSVHLYITGDTKYIGAQLFHGCRSLKTIKFTICKGASQNAGGYRHLYSGGREGEIQELIERGWTNTSNIYNKYEEYNSLDKFWLVEALDHGRYNPTQHVDKQITIEVTFDSDITNSTEDMDLKTAWRNLIQDTVQFYNFNKENTESHPSGIGYSIEFKN